MQLDLFTPESCPCGEIPIVDEREDGFAVFSWCYCPLVLVVEKEYPKALEKWAEVTRCN